MVAKATDGEITRTQGLSQVEPQGHSACSTLTGHLGFPKLSTHYGAYTRKVADYGLRESFALDRRAGLPVRTQSPALPQPLGPQSS